MSIVTFTIDFPLGGMKRNGPLKPVPRDWIATSVTGTGEFVVPFDIPAGSRLRLTEVIPDAYAHVNPFLGTGSVLPFVSEYTLTLVSDGDVT